MRQYARLLDLDEAPLGGPLSVGVTATDTTLYVEDAGDFAEDGGKVVLNETVLDYVSADLDEGVIALAGPAGITAEAEDDFVAVADNEGVPATEPVALVALDNADPDDEPLIAEIDSALVPYLTDGLRSGDEAESVEVDVSDEGYVRVVNIVRERLRMRGSYVDPEGLPFPTPSAAPGASPAPTALPGIDTLFVSWEPVESDYPVVYDVHVSTSGGGFTPSPSTYVGTSSGTQYVVRNAGGVDLDPGTTYYVRIVARNDAGAAPASVPSSGSPLPPVDLSGLQDQIDEAQATADGKIVTFWEPSPPIADGVGDVWYDTANGNLPHRWDGAEWVPLPVGNEATTPDVVAGKIVPLNAGMSLEWGVPDPAVPAYEVVAELMEVARPPEWVKGELGSLSWPVANATFDGSRFVEIWSFETTPNLGGPRSGIPVYTDPATGEYELGPVLPGNIANHGGGIAFVGGHFYVLGYVPVNEGGGEYTDLRVRAYDVNWNQVDEWLVSPSPGAVNTSWHRGDLATDGTDLYVLLHEHLGGNDYTVRVRRYTTTGSLVSTTNLTPALAADLPTGFVGFTVGEFDLGAFRYAVATQPDVVSTKVRMFDGSGTEQPGEEFTYPHSTHGIAWHEDRFYVSTVGSLRATVPHTVDRTLWLAYSWADTDPEGGTHETAVSPIAGPVNVPARVGLRIHLAPDLPDVDEQQAPDTVYVYVYDGPTEPSVSQLVGPAPARFSRRVVFDPGGAYYHVDPPTSGSAPPTTSTFPVGASGVVESETGGLVLRGDGTGDWPYLRRRIADDAAAQYASAGHRHPGYEARLSAIEGADTGNLAASNGFTGSVRAIRHGNVVYIVGSMTNPTLTGTVWTSTGIVLPAGFRPPALVDFPISTSWASNNAFGFRLHPDGTLECRRQSTSGLSMGLAFPFFV